MGEPRNVLLTCGGTALVCLPPDLAELCFDKACFQRFAEAAGLNPPRGFAPGELDRTDYPFFYKRRRGFGWIGSGLRAPSRSGRSARSRTADCGAL
jgi:hypothetical protein